MADGISGYQTIVLAFEGRIARLTLTHRPGLNMLFLRGSGRLVPAGVGLDARFLMQHVEDPSVYSGTRLLN